MKPYNRTEERTGVQDAAAWAPHTDIQCDFVMIYGTHNLEDRIRTYKEHGYEVHLMTGVSWGEYQDYLYGKFDGIDHHDEGQVDRAGNEINHGKDIPYMVPSIAFSRYLVTRLKEAVDLGINAIHLEEPEFWTRAGYSDAFKREWQIYYGEPWSDPALSTDAAYRCGRLKQYLYTRMLDRLCSELKEYAMVRHGRLLRFYVPTHSLINYAQWGIVSPESALLDLPCIDGYIAQIWTGTSRTPNFYEGVRAERTFETAYLEYGVMQELVRGTTRRMWFLQDPVEDDPNHTWTDYRCNYYRTLVAALMHPGVSRYEVAPWPSRVFGSLYPNEGSDEKTRIPEDYKTNLLTVMQILRNMEQDKVCREGNAEAVGLLIADSAMYQRHPHDGMKQSTVSLEFDAFYGLALPLLKRGLPIRPVQLDNVRRVPGYLNDYRVLILSYEFMKPDHPDLHPALAQWITEGGTLLYVGDGSDTFHAIRHWWNSGTADYETPIMHLTEALGLGRSPAPGIHTVGKGRFCLLAEDPVALSRDPEKADAYRALVHEAMAQAGLTWEQRSDMILHRGPYAVTVVMAESVDETPKVLHGSYIDLFDASLPVVENPILAAGSVGLWYDLSKIPTAEASEILAAAARIDDITETERALSFRAVCTGDSTCVVRIASPRTPIAATANCGEEARDIALIADPASRTYLLRFANSTDGVSVKVVYE